MRIPSSSGFRAFFTNLGGISRPNTVILDPPRRCAGVKKKFNLEDNPKKVKPSVLVKTLRGFQFNDGDFVYKGDILVRQIGLEIYPGESVKLDRETWDLIAMCNGRFTISTETLSPFPDSPLYEAVHRGEQIVRPFVHVISEPIEPVYRLKRML
ncbi:Mitochondrial 39S ribosomal protein L27 L27mt [Fasciola gigantica]|uniref:Mitochondrial 39S ribosomal protein L27 L27mt n=1 Tax=Fasciola gigantica TaxID=46835 RepID=A0A504YS14_FASGI|nr:Mitochondrial 39S ribosomal protein L27 L27mt [Fasciola gigantica]